MKLFVISTDIPSSVTIIHGTEYAFNFTTDGSSVNIASTTASANYTKSGFNIYTKG